MFAQILAASRVAARLRCKVSLYCYLIYYLKIDAPKVLLQAMREDPPPDARCRDKFLVQSVAITPDRDLANIIDTVRPLQILISF